MTGGAGGLAGARPARRPPPARRPGFRLTVLAMPGVLVLAGLAVAWVGQRAAASTSARPVVAWALRPASNTVAIRLARGSGPLSGWMLDHSRLTVSGAGNGQLRRQSPGGGMVRVPVPPGRQTHLLVQVAGPRPFRQTLTVTVPPALRVIAARRGHGGLLVRVSAPLRRRAPRPLCGENKVSLLASSVVVVARSPDVCRTRLRLTAQNGEQAVMPVTIPALPQVPLYSFASPAGRAIYITVDDGWTPSPRVLAIMRRTQLPVAAFLIEQAAQQNLPYWRAFVRAGGTVGDHTVSHPDLTRLTLARATTQWGEARRALGRWLGRGPLMGRPPYGAFNHAVEVAAYRAGLKMLVGWSATIDHGRIRTWDGNGLEPGEIVLLHWVPGLGGQLTMLLAAIRAQHLNPMPLTPASFAGIASQQRSLSGD
jgi:peptidoglycan/xylan/chitin deacetylase (PgdA/CDA1 family)